MNALLSASKDRWTHFGMREERQLSVHPQKRAPEPFQTVQGYLVKGRRLSDDCAQSGSPYRSLWNRQCRQPELDRNTPPSSVTE